MLFCPRPAYRIVASDDAAPFVAKGGNLFARHVLDVDREIRAGEEVLVVDSQRRAAGYGNGSPGDGGDDADQARPGGGGSERRRSIELLIPEGKIANSIFRFFSNIHGFIGGDQ